MVLVLGLEKVTDNTHAGVYFVTIVAWQREMSFGEIQDGELILNELCEIVLRNGNERRWFARTWN
jgi:hypothetical protein